MILLVSAPYWKRIICPWGCSFRAAVSFQSCAGSDKMAKGQNTIQNKPKEFTSAEAEVTLLLSVEPLCWLVNTYVVGGDDKEPQDQSTISEGKGYAHHTPALLGFLTQFDTRCSLSSLAWDPNLHSSQAHPVQVSAWHSFCLQAKPLPTEQKRCCAWAWWMWVDQHRSSMPSLPRSGTSV